MPAAVKARGIIMTGESIPALLNTKPGVWPAEPIDSSKPFKWKTRRVIQRPERFMRIRDCVDLSPYGTAGDCLYMKETYGYTKGNGIRVVYRADGDPPQELLSPDQVVRGMRWKSPIFMKRHEARAEFDLVGVAVEQLGEISEADGKAEGVAPSPESRTGADRLTVVPPSYRLGYFKRWTELHGDTPRSTWVWVLTLARIA
jgi:hypothetical protein